MNRHWYRKEIDDLIHHSKERFDTEIPLVGEILALDHFLFELDIFYHPKDRCVVKKTVTGTKTVLKWFHRGWSRVEEIELPEGAVYAIRGEVVGVLDNKCNHLAEISGYKRKEGYIIEGL